MESALRQLEREKALLQHKNAEYQRKADHEADKKRNLENDGLWCRVLNTKKKSLHVCGCIVLKLAIKMLFIIVNSLKDQLEDLKKRNQNSQISTEKVNQLQRQVSWSYFVIRILNFTYDCLLTFIVIGSVTEGKSLGRYFWTFVHFKQFVMGS